MTKVCGSDTQSSNYEKKVGGIVGIKQIRLWDFVSTWVTVIVGRGEKVVNRRQRDRGRRMGQREVKYYVDKCPVNLDCIP